MIRNNEKTPQTFTECGVFGAPGRSRTCGLSSRSRTLYPLSYKRLMISIITQKTAVNKKKTTHLKEADQVSGKKRYSITYYMNSI